MISIKRVHLALLLVLLLASLVTNVYLFVEHGGRSSQAGGGDEGSLNIAVFDGGKSSRHSFVKQEADAQQVLRAPGRAAAGLSVSRAEVELLFASADYLTALQALEYLPQGEGFALRIDWLGQCLAWIVDDEHPERVAAFIDAGLAINSFDPDFRQLRAEQLIAQGSVLKGIDILYELLQQADPALQGDYASRLQQLFGEQVRQFEEQQAWQPMVTFVERLLWHEPGHPPYLMVHARALAKLQNYALARASLQTILNDQYYGARARELLQSIDRMAVGAKRIALRTQGRHYLVDVQLDQRHTATLMIDTGASVTVVTQQYFDRALAARADYRRDMTIATAGGKVRARLYQIEQFMVGPYSIDNFEIAVMPLDTLRDSDGLLGMNFLSRFEFEIDQKKSELILAPRN